MVGSPFLCEWSAPRSSEIASVGGVRVDDFVPKRRQDLGYVRAEHVPGQVVDRRLLEVHHGDGGAVAGGDSRKRGGGLYLERGADREEDVGAAGERLRPLERRRREAFAEEHDVGFQEPAAVAVRRNVTVGDPRLHRPSVVSALALGATNAPRVTVEFDEVGLVGADRRPVVPVEFAADLSRRRAVEAVGVLRDDRVEVPAPAQLGERPVGGVRLVGLLAVHRPAQFEPVAPEPLGIAPEPAVRELPLLETVPDPILAAKRGDAGGSGDSGPRQDRGSLRRSDLPCQRLEVADRFVRSAHTRSVRPEAEKVARSRGGRTRCVGIGSTAGTGRGAAAAPFERTPPRIRALKSRLGQLGGMQDRTYTADAEPGDEVTVAGWVHEIRDLGGIAFLILRDSTGRIQVKFEKDEMDDELVETGLGAARESVVSVSGAVEEEPRAPTGVEVVPETVEVIAPADPELPLDPSGKVDADLSTRLDNRTLDLRKPDVQAVFEIRSAMLRAVRERFRELDATEITTPKIVATGTEGGTELFPITYFGEEAFMNQSPQLFKQLAAGSNLERVFEIGPIFRAEEHNTPRHLNEATSIDFEGAYCDDGDAMDVAEEVVTAAYEAIAEECADELDALGLDEEFAVPDGEFPRLTYEEAIERINATGELDEQLVWGDDLSTEAEKALGEDVGSHYFITNWPSEIKPFYIKDHDGEPDLSTGFDLMHPRMELVSGGQREHREGQLIEGFEQQGLDPDQFEYYTKMFKYGMPPHAGFGLGGERLLMTILGLDNIREAVLFPRDRQRLSP